MANDEEIQGIIDQAQDQVGVGDLLMAYELVEQHYFAALAHGPFQTAFSITITSNTSGSPALARPELSSADLG